jgi:hypothetical protein
LAKEAKEHKEAKEDKDQKDSHKEVGKDDKDGKEDKDFKEDDKGVTRTMAAKRSPTWRRSPIKTISTMAAMAVRIPLAEERGAHRHPQRGLGAGRERSRLRFSGAHP